MTASQPDEAPLHTREYGTAGPFVVVLHGGPGAAGYMAPVARELADLFRVVEPFQRGSGNQPLTVARHVDDLHVVVKSQCGGQQPAIVGHSWGAMLALAYAAAHPECVRSLVLVGCGTFDSASRDQMKAIRKQRMAEVVSSAMARELEDCLDPDQRLRAQGRLAQQVDSYELIPGRDETVRYDARGHEETWTDVLQLQDNGVVPAAFSVIGAPVIMLHGSVDPHPGQMIRESLQPHLPQLEYHQWEQCGHYPWLEKAARNEFFAMLRDWLLQH